MVYHMYSGYTLLGLVLFRLLWAFGSTYARFSHFVRGPRTILSYAKRFSKAHRPIPSHNPLGGLMVVVLLLLVVQAEPDCLRTTIYSSKARWRNWSARIPATGSPVSTKPSTCCTL
ncbi:MAG: hypothetical protein R3F37_12520 [Candidatus Competibacteraceae bacterium]